MNDDLSFFINCTVSHYQTSSQSFWESTKDHDVDQNYAAFQTRLPSFTGMNILDLGCGPGRDLKHFKKRGHIPVGIDACENFCRMARDYTGCEVWQQNFCNLDLPENFFDGVFANASLFHTPKFYFPDVLKKLHKSLKPEGILFSSNPRGNGEHFDGERYGYYMEFDEYTQHLSTAGFEVIGHYYRPTGWPRSKQPWLAVVSKKADTSTGQLAN